jgi:peptidyl-prolyl cis-trans isomerase C
VNQKLLLAGIGFVFAAFAQTPPKPPATHTEPGVLAPGVEVPDPNKVVLTIGDEKLTAAQYDKLLDALPAQYQKAARGPQKRQIAEQIVQLKVLSSEAEKRKVDQQPEVKQQLAFDRQNVLAGALFQEMSKSVSVDDAAVKAYYDEHKGDYETATASHILIRFKGSAVPLRAGMKEMTEDESLAHATEVRKKLIAGADFATTAKAESDDSGSGANGGDLGTFKHGQMVPAFETAAFSLPLGEVSEPIRTQFGYHLIKVSAKQAKTMAEARPEIEDKLRPELAKKQMDDIRKKSAVTFDEGYFGPVTAAPPAPAPVK